MQGFWKCNPSPKYVPDFSRPNILLHVSCCVDYTVYLGALCAALSHRELWRRVSNRGDEREILCLPRAPQLPHMVPRKSCLNSMTSYNPSLSLLPRTSNTGKAKDIRASAVCPSVRVLQGSLGSGCLLKGQTTTQLPVLTLSHLSSPREWLQVLFRSNETQKRSQWDPLL